jgi:pre-mRNA cleavage complex 2 protein Pcf11
MNSAPPPIPQPAIQAPPPVNWHSEPQYPPQGPYSRPTSATVKLEDPVGNTAIPPAVAIPPFVAAPSVPQLQAPAAPSLPAVPSGDLNNLFATLLKAGVVSANSTPIGAGATVKEREASIEPEKTTDPTSESVREYRDAILAENIDFNNLETVEYVNCTSDSLVMVLTCPSSRPTSIIYFLYERQGLQCRQCGVRFPDTQLGKRNQNDHLDMHFRQNRKANDDLGRGHSRSWFVALDVRTLKKIYLPTACLVFDK